MDRNFGALTTNEKAMIISVYFYLQKNIDKQIIKLSYHQDFCLRKEVALATGIILAEFNKTGEFALPKQGQQPPQDFKPEYVNAIHDIISSANQKCLQLTLQMILFELSELNFPVSKAQLVPRNYLEMVNIELYDEDEGNNSANVLDLED
ncbi:17722_t:CDS:2 [Gigaspora margarita]|uniref:17722_t:CDS:1 n=1 Tax=Gigaspora margarita TaxID=4874 RepID=A0ABN7W3V1_GIGMA|nr:17722_t:CDS:2 [Gigaspora margarita]